MIDTREKADGEKMCNENKVKRPSILSMKFRLREERKKVIRITKVKYHNIEDHEIGMRRFCLIRNTLKRLNREVREEKLARNSGIGNHVSPSYLSASNPGSFSPPYEIQADEVLRAYGQPASSPVTALDDEDEMPPCKRLRLDINYNKENKEENFYEDQLIDVVGHKDESCAIDDAQDILRDVYKNYTGESLSQYLPSSQILPTQPDTPYSSTICDSTSNSPTSLGCSSDLNTCSSNLDNVGCLSLSGCMEKSKSHQQYPCGHSALLGNDLQSVVYQSLITSL